MELKTIQAVLKAAGHYSGEVDGLVGPKTLAAAEIVLKSAGLDIAVVLKWHLQRRRIAAAQAGLNQLGHGAGTVDGLLGPNTYAALEEFNKQQLVGHSDVWRDIAVPLTPSLAKPGFPHQSKAARFYGDPGTGHTMLELPWPMRLAWDEGTKIERFVIHEKCHDSALSAFTQIGEAYNEAQRQNLGIDIFAGCYNDRNKRGGRTKSLHAYACAIDFDSARNGLHWTRERARLAQADCVKFFEIWESVGWTSLGRTCNFDWMHVQAAGV